MGDLSVEPEVDAVCRDGIRLGEPSADLFLRGLSQHVIVPVQHPKRALLKVLGIRRPHQNIVPGIAGVCRVCLHREADRFHACGPVVFTQAGIRLEVIQGAVLLHCPTVAIAPAGKGRFHPACFQVPQGIGAFTGDPVGHHKEETIPANIRI